MNIPLPKEITYLLETIQCGGFEAFIVGGCIRDVLIAREVHDFDITTNALPPQILQLFSSFTVLETGIKHGTLTVVINHMPIEITTYRIDGTYTDHRRPDGVLFTKSLLEDLKRRDFTMNALAYNPQTGIIDYFNGKEDIHNKIIRTVGSPDERFTEDGLRIMRALRFSAVLGFQIEEDTKKSIHMYKDKLKHISIERITSELSEMLCGQYVEEVLLEFSDIIGVIIPELSLQSKDNPAYSTYEYGVKILSHTKPVLHLRLAVLLHNINKLGYFSYEKAENIQIRDKEKTSATLAKKILKNMHFDKETINKTCTVIAYYNIDLREDKKCIKRWMNKLAPNVLKELLQVRRAELLIQDSKDSRKLNQINKINDLIDEIIASNSCYSIKGLAVNGQDLIKLGIRQGKVIGEILQQLLEEVVEENVLNHKEELLDLARSMYKSKK